MTLQLNPFPEGRRCWGREGRTTSKPRLDEDMARSAPFVPSKTPPVLGLLLVAAVLFFARDVLVPIALAVLVTFLLAPVIRRLERLRIPRLLSVLLVVGVSTVFVGGLAWAVEAQLVEVATQLPKYRTNILQKLGALRATGTSAMGEAGTRIANLGREIIKPAPADGESAPPGSLPAAPEPIAVKVISAEPPPLTYAKAVVGPVLAQLATAGAVVVFAGFMLMRREDLRNRVVRLAGERDIHGTTRALDDAAERVSRYLRMQLISNGSAGLAIGGGLFALGIPGAALWGLVTAVMRFLPYVGVWIAAVLPLAVALAVAPGWTTPLLALALIVLVEVVVGSICEPLLFGSGTGLSPVAVLTSAAVWAWLWGPVGLLLATPLTVCLAVIGKHVPRLAFLNILLGDDPVLTPEASLYQRLLAGDQEEAAQVVERFAKERPLAEVYDLLIVPAMRLAETDRHRGELDERQEHSILEIVASIVEDAGAFESVVGPSASSDGRSVSSVLCIPARDPADAIAARMLAQLLTHAGIAADGLPAPTLSGELMEHVAAKAPALVCVSAVPPSAALHARVLCKRLRARFPDLALVVGLWDGKVGQTAARERLGKIGTDYVAINMAEAIDQIRSLSSVTPSRREEGSRQQEGAEPSSQKRRSEESVPK
jgi:predicted PurR-regulated permease PerM